MAEDTLVARVSRLDQLISQPRRAAAAASAGRAGKAPCLRSLQALAGREALLDALVALYDECNKDGLKQNALIAGFVNKCECSVYSVPILLWFVDAYACLFLHRLRSNYA